MLTLFVYYKLPAGEHAHWYPRVQAFLAAARARWPGTSVELLQRPAPNAQGLETWMEVWQQPGGIPPERAAALDAMARDAGLPFARASEAFRPCAADS